MFKVRRKADGRIFTVYGFTVMRFLVWNEEEGHWEWPEQDLFEPLEE